jgi:hypothetical protein
MVSNKPKKIKKLYKKSFCWLKVTEEKSRIRIRIKTSRIRNTSRFPVLSRKKPMPDAEKRERIGVGYAVLCLYTGSEPPPLKASLLNIRVYRHSIDNGVSKVTVYKHQRSSWCFYGQLTEWK